MPEVTASMVKDLREKTGACMTDCKKALDEAKGDMEAAVDWLRKKGLSAAAKKAGRVAAEGLVALASADKKAAVVEVNAETDFVARNEQFQNFALQTAKLALDSGADAEALKAKQQDTLTSLIATIGENMTIRRAAMLGVKQGIVASYVHNALAPNLGRIGVLVALESTGDTGKLMELGKQLAMHVASTRPDAVEIANVDAKSLERERAIFT